MNVAVAYYSKTGNTKKVAEAVAGALGCRAESIADYDGSKPVDVLFIGGSIYGGLLDPSLAQFIRSLDAKAVKKAVVFSTHVSGEKANELLRTALVSQGIPVERSYSCKGKFMLFNLGHPNGAELEDARRFAADMVSSQV